MTYIANCSSTKTELLYFFKEILSYKHNTHTYTHLHTVIHIVKFLLNKEKSIIHTLIHIVKFLLNKEKILQHIESHRKHIHSKNLLFGVKYSIVKKKRKKKKEKKKKKNKYR